MFERYEIENLFLRLITKHLDYHISRQVCCIRKEYLEKRLQKVRSGLCIHFLPSFYKFPPLH